MTKLIRDVLKYYQPVVRLTAVGRRQLNAGQPRRGKLISMLDDGRLRIRKFGNKSVDTYAPIFWEMHDDQDAERAGQR